MPDFRNMWDCAAAGCERTVEDSHLERISPKGPGCKFIGLCTRHYGKSVVLKPEAAEMMPDDV